MTSIIRAPKTKSLTFLCASILFLGSNLVVQNAEAHGNRLRNKLKQVVAKDEIRDALSCWGRGMDLTLENKGPEGKAEWDKCYAHPDYKFQVLLLGQVAAKGNSTEDRMNTNVQTGGAFGYTSAQHYVSNFQIEFTGPRSAVAKALQKANHFKDSTLDVETTFGVITVEFVKTRDGWKAIDEKMDIQKFIGLTGVPAPAGP